MSGERPPTALIVVLVGSLLLAGWVYGRPLLTGPDPADETFFEPSDLGFVDEVEIGVDVEPWSPPETPRNPFLPVDLTATPPEGDDPAGAGTGDDLGE